MSAPQVGIWQLKPELSLRYPDIGRVCRGPTEAQYQTKLAGQSGPLSRISMPSSSPRAPGQVLRRRTTLPLRSIPMILWRVVFGLGLQVSPGFSVRLSSPCVFTVGRFPFCIRRHHRDESMRQKRWWTHAGEIRVTNRIQKEGTVLSGILY